MVRTGKLTQGLLLPWHVNISLVGCDKDLDFQIKTRLVPGSMPSGII